MPLSCCFRRRSQALQVWGGMWAWAPARCCLPGARPRSPRFLSGDGSLAPGRGCSGHLASGLHGAYDPEFPKGGRPGAEMGGGAVAGRGRSPGELKWL